MTIASKPTTPILDEDQRRVAEAGIRERLYVTAGPGSGKTETVSSRIQYLVENEDLAGEEILIISFSRAAVEAIERRRRLDGGQSWVWVSTIDSLAARILVEDGFDITGLGFDARIERLTKTLVEDEGKEILPDVRHVIIDEVQDIVGIRANLIVHILDTLPTDVGFTMLGDPKQGIYDFQLDEKFSDPDQLVLGAKERGAVEVTLAGQYRAVSRDAKEAMKLRGEDRTGFAWISDMRGFITKMPSLDADGLADQLRLLDGTVAVLVQSNAQALTVARDLHMQGIQAELLARSADRSIDPWFAEVLAAAPGSVTRGQFAELAGAGDSIDSDEGWVLLRSITRANTKYLNVREAAQRLANGVVPVALTKRRSQLTVSTVHRAKGLEFDHVLLLDPVDWYGDQDREFGRTLYVAITRPRRRLYSFRRQPSDRSWKNSDRTERAYRTNFRGKGTTGFEIRGSDWRTLTPPGDVEDLSAAQALLTELAVAATPTPVDIRFNAYESTLSRPRYDAYVGDVCIGTLGEAFTESFIRQLGSVGRNWPTIGGTFFTGVETVAGPPQKGQVGANGLWLSPLIVGPATLEWSRT